jgi:hypothetical protein
MRVDIGHEIFPGHQQIYVDLPPMLQCEEKPTKSQTSASRAEASAHNRNKRVKPRRLLPPFVRRGVSWTAPVIEQSNVYQMGSDHEPSSSEFLPRKQRDISSRERSFFIVRRLSVEQQIYVHTMRVLKKGEEVADVVSCGPGDTDE